MRALAIALTGLAVLAAPAQADSIFVSAGTSRFSPANLDVLVGDNVIWRNNSVKTHNVKSESEGYNSGRIAPVPRRTTSSPRPAASRTSARSTTA